MDDIDPEDRQAVEDHTLAILVDLQLQGYLDTRVSIAGQQWRLSEKGMIHAMSKWHSLPEVDRVLYIMMINNLRESSEEGKDVEV